MKTQINISNIVKEAAILAVLLVLLCVLPSANVGAQTIQSAQYRCGTHFGEDVVLRESSSGWQIISYHGSIDGTVSGACFEYGDLYPNAVKQFYIPDTIQVTGSIKYRIKDMCVLGDMCYFCGVRMFVYNQVDPETGGVIADSTGILGRFRLDPSGFGSTEKYDIKYFSSTKILNRMAETFTAQDTAVVAVGIMNNSASESCLLVARRRASMFEQWKYIVKKVSAPEVFTDIAVDAGMVTVSSYDRTATGKRHFGLRKSKKSEVTFYSALFEEFDSLYVYDLSVGDMCMRFVRPDNTDVLLSGVPWKMKVYAGFACTFDTCSNSPCQTALCEVETENMGLNAMQIVQKMHSTPHTLVDMKYLYKTLGDESGATVGLLHLTTDRFKTVVEYPYALISSYTDAVPRALLQRLEVDAMVSMSAYQGNDVRFGGNRNSKVTCLQEILPGIDDGSLCMQNGETEVLTIDHSQYPSRSKKTLSDMTEGLQDMVWETKTVYPKPVVVDNICIH